MSLPVTAEPLPTSITFGKVVGRVIHLIADTAEDTDDKPQARAAAGKVTFTPRNVVRRTTEPDYSAFVLHAPEEATLSATGRILDREGRQGIWLAAGEYEVTFSISGGGRASIPSFPINVTTEHTDAAPMDLAKEAPYVPPPGTTVQTVLIPSGGTTGQVLVRAADGGLVWADPPEGTGGTGGAVDSVNGETGVVVLTAADVGAQPAGDYATTTALSDGLATKVNSSTYTAGLAGKVDDTDPRLTDARTPTAHEHPIGDLTAAGTPTDTTFLRGDGTWAQPPAGDGGGVTDHTALTGRTAADSHPIAAITGLQGALDGKQPTGSYATTADVTSASTADRSRTNHTGTQSLDTTTDSATRLAMTATERTKLGGIPTGATANSTDAALRDRATHTGAQPISTVTGLQTALDGKLDDADGVELAATTSGTLTADPVASGLAADAGHTHRLPDISGGAITLYTADGTAVSLQVVDGVVGGGSAGLDLEQVQDAVAAMFTGGAHNGVAFSYDDTAGVINATASGGGGDTTAPTAPTSLAAGTPTDTTIPITWTASTDATGVAGYEAFNGGVLLQTGLTGTSGTLTGLTASTQYALTLKAYDAAGNRSPASNSVTASTAAPAGGGAGAFSDDFNRADGPVGNGWSATGSGSFTVASNQLANTGAAFARAKLWRDLGADGTLSVTFAVGNEGGLLFRYVDDSNFWVVENKNLLKFVNGTQTDALGHGFYFANLANPYEMQIVLAGSSIKVYYGADLAADIVDTDHQAATKHGVLVNNPADRFDNFTYTP